jgi:hypothetical protein
MSFSDVILNLQKLLLAIFAVSAVILIGLILATDPFANQVYFIAFLADLFVLLSSFFSL